MSLLSAWFGLAKLIGAIKSRFAASLNAAYFVFGAFFGGSVWLVLYSIIADLRSSAR
jgi:hypothetical protein